MRNAARDLAKRLDLLRLGELRLSCLTRSDLFSDAVLQFISQVSKCYFGALTLGNVDN